MDSGITKPELSYFCAHGTGTVENDKAEARALSSLDSANGCIKVTSIKSALGHTMGAASAIEAISCCLAIRHSIIPPTINLEQLDPECEIDVVTGKNYSRAVNSVINNSQAFGGNNSTVVFKKCD